VASPCTGKRRAYRRGREETAPAKPYYKLALLACPAAVPGRYKPLTRSTVVEEYCPRWGDFSNGGRNGRRI
jgi:hypothetical protein